MSNDCLKKLKVIDLKNLLALDLELYKKESLPALALLRRESRRRRRRLK